MKINGKEIGDNNPTFITFEAGPTHDGFETAQKLIQYAHRSGADAVKFQIFNPERLVSDKKMLYSYEVLLDKITGRKEKISEPLYDILKRRCLSKSEWFALKKYSDELGIAFFATVSDAEDIELVTELGCHSIKIASADINHISLLTRASQTGLVIQIDTGNATFGEIENAFDIIQEAGNENIIIHNCPSGYPARLESINLKMIPTLKQMFNVPIAYSDHTPGYEMDIAAVALGANLVEKTITLDRCQRSVEHIMSLEPEEMNDFIQVIRDLEIALGKPRRYMDRAEKEKRLNIRRSVMISKRLEKGGLITLDNLVYRRPGYGIPPDEFEKIIGKKAKRSLRQGHVLRWEDFE